MAVARRSKYNVQVRDSMYYVQLHRFSRKHLCSYREPTAEHGLLTSAPHHVLFRLEMVQSGKKPQLSLSHYKIVKPPPSMISEQGEKNKRVCAVLGGTGFVGGHIVDELVRRKSHYVFVLGRKIRPEKINPDADCLIQVDMADLDGLTSAFQGVDLLLSLFPLFNNSPETVFAKNTLIFRRLQRRLV